MHIGAREAVILGFNTDVLPQLGEAPTRVLSEIVALNETRRSFVYKPADGRRCMLRFAEIHDRVDVTVNGKAVGVLLWKPWELDITESLTDGENTVSWQVTGSAANTYGKPVEVGVSGVTVEITDEEKK